MKAQSAIVHWQVVMATELESCKNFKKDLKKKKKLIPSVKPEMVLAFQITLNEFQVHWSCLQLVYQVSQVLSVDIY